MQGQGQINSGEKEGTQTNAHTSTNKHSEWRMSCQTREKEIMKKSHRIARREEEKIEKDRDNQERWRKSRKIETIEKDRGNIDREEEKVSVRQKMKLSGCEAVCLKKIVQDKMCLRQNDCGFMRGRKKQLTMKKQ